jgi:carbonic anhydrase
MEVIVNQSDIVKDLLQKKQIGIIGGVYSLTSGLVEFDHQNAIFS